MTDLKRLTDLTWPDGRPKIAPVQGYAQGIPWSLHLKAYNVYCKMYGGQEAMIDLAGRGCRGGFSVGELDEFVPGWRDEVEELGQLRKRAEAAEAENAKLRETLKEIGSLLGSPEDESRLSDDRIDRIRALTTQQGEKE